MIEAVLAFMKDLTEKVADILVTEIFTIMRY